MESESRIAESWLMLNVAGRSRDGVHVALVVGSVAVGTPKLFPPDLSD